jgi:dethiobiotin synthetase
VSSRRLFVAGTDTGVGKTTTIVALLAALAGRVRCAAFKPAETGCVRTAVGDLIPEDGTRLQAAAHPNLPLDLVCPFRYALPAAPQVAAEVSGAAPFTLAIASQRLAALEPAANAELTFIEGAGGVLVPFTAELTAIDVAKALGCVAALVIGRAALGTVNHTLLTIRELRRQGIEPIGVILSSSEAVLHPAGFADARLIEAHGATPVLGTLPFLAGASGAGSPPSRSDLAAAATRSLDLDRLLAAAGFSAGRADG